MRKVYIPPSRETTLSFTTRLSKSEHVVMSEKSKFTMKDLMGEELYQEYLDGEEEKKKKNAEKEPVTVKPYVLGKKRSSNDDNQDKAVKITCVDEDKAVKITRVDEDVAGKISEDVKRNPEYRCINCSRIFKYR